jgi:hypothetical protein
MTPSKLILCSVLLLLLGPASQAAQNTPSSTFVGTWVGTQKWAIESSSPSATEDQLVELSIEVGPDGKLTGFMNPWFGGSDGATFTQTAILGDELQAHAVVGKPPAPGQRGQRGNWKNSVRIFFKFKNESNSTLVGTADVMLNDVKWLKFDYSLGKKRSRY